MTIYYVNILGNNNNNGLSPNFAFKTIDYAINQTIKGDIINIEQGTYDIGSNSMNIGLLINKEISLLGNSRPNIVINTNTNGKGILCNTSNIIIKDLDITHISLYSSSDTCISFTNQLNNNIVIDNCKINYSKVGIESNINFFQVINSHFYNILSSNIDSKAILIKTQNGTNIISNNYYTTNNNYNINGLYYDIMSSNNKNNLNGFINYRTNVNNFYTSKVWIDFSPNSSMGKYNDLYSMNIFDNFIYNTSKSFIRIAPSLPDTLDYFGNVYLGNNYVSNVNDGYINIDFTWNDGFGNSFVNPYIDDIIFTANTVLPKFTIYNTNSTNGNVNFSNISIPFRNVKNVLGITGYRSLPTNIDDIAVVPFLVSNVTSNLQVTNLVEPITAAASIVSPPLNLGVFQVITEDKPFSNATPQGEQFIVETPYQNVAGQISVIAKDKDNQPITDFTANPITVIVDLPNVKPELTFTIVVYKVDNNGIILPVQPPGLPQRLTFVGDTIWSFILKSLSSYILLVEKLNEFGYLIDLLRIVKRSPTPVDIKIHQVYVIFQIALDNKIGDLIEQCRFYLNYLYNYESKLKLDL